MMKDKRTIIVRNSKLRKVRNSFRFLFIRMNDKRWEAYHSEQHELLRDKEGKLRNMSASKKARFRIIQEGLDKITKTIRSSICQCAACGSSEEDMTFNSILEEWFCVDCYKGMGDYYYEQKEERAKGLVHDDFNEEFYKSFI